MSRVAMVLCFVVAASSACKPRGEDVRFDGTLVPKLTERVTHVLNEPEVTAGFDALATAISADPVLRTRGEALLGALTADPAIAKALTQLLAKVQKSPDLQHVVTELVAANPGMSPAQIGELAANRLKAAWSSAPISQAWMRTWNRLVAKLELGPVPAVIDAQIANRVIPFFVRHARLGATG